MIRSGVQTVITALHNGHLAPSACRYTANPNTMPLVHKSQNNDSKCQNSSCVTLHPLSISDVPWKAGPASDHKIKLFAGSGDPLHKTYASTFTIRLFITEIVARVHKKGLIIFNSPYVTRSASSL
ncbi:hypothetical protein Zmor_024763 [Zophobas morio]|uniref:Uncharacterized protein n=1 Tax=Zophobas morio TaxID=2755281 RepID=A0AA38I5E8_9CUCU|nr:hypothetical protein Zmor_024763 [Zophobas morio]